MYKMSIFYVPTGSIKSIRQIMENETRKISVLYSVAKGGLYSLEIVRIDWGYRVKSCITQNNTIQNNTKQYSKQFKSCIV